MHFDITPPTPLRHLSHKGEPPHAPRPTFPLWIMQGWTWCCVCILLLCATTSHATLPMSQDFTWGLSLSTFRNLDFDIEAEWPIWERATAVRIHTNDLAEDGSLILVFDHEFGLIKTHWASKPIERDETGIKGLESFEQFKATISKQYGAPQETKEEPSLTLQGFHGNFYQCLQDSTCGPWESIWQTPDGEVLILELVGLDPGVGFIQLTHQGPNLKDFLRQAHPGLNSQEHEI